MNVVFIQKHAGRGGSKSSLAESLSALTADGSITPRVISAEQGPFTARCGALGVPVDIAPLPEWRKFMERIRFPGAMKSIAGSLASARPDWIISNEMWWGPHAARIARHLGCRSAVILRDGIATIPKAKQYRLWENDLILPVSSTIADALRPDPLFHDRVHVLFNSVSIAAPRADAEENLSAMLSAYPAVGRWLLVVGKLSPRKNQVDAVRITRSLIDSGHPDLGLLLAGDIDPAYLPEMEQTIATSGMQDRVALIGNFDGVATLLEKAYSVILPSFREGLPRSLVEAITAGVPAFSYPCEGVEDIFEEHLPVFVSGESTPESLSAVIRRAWECPERCSAEFAAVRHRVIRKFSPEAHSRNLRALLSA